MHLPSKLAVLPLGLAILGWEGMLLLLPVFGGNMYTVQGPSTWSGAVQL